MIIEEDIENIVKEHIEELIHKSITVKYEKEEFKILQAVIKEQQKELEIKDREILDIARGKFEARKENFELKQELETYKKIAKKLAYYTKDTKLIIKDCVGWGCTKGIECTDCIIDWARKEVKNEN